MSKQDKGQTPEVRTIELESIYPHTASATINEKGEITSVTITSPLPPWINPKPRKNRIKIVTLNGKNPQTVENQPTPAPSLQRIYLHSEPKKRIENY